MSVKVAEFENVVRLLFSHRMTGEDGELTPEAFPTDELIEKNNKSVSVDREEMLLDYNHILNKLITYERPEKGRAKWGSSHAIVDAIVSIKDQDGTQVFRVLEDPLENYPPAPWDAAHAKIVRADESFSKGFIRGYRDKLVKVFQSDVRKIF